MNAKFGVIFDMDGVLVNSNPEHKESTKLFCEKHNRQISEDFLEARVYGRTNKEWIPEIFGDISEDEMESLADEKEELFRNMFDPGAAVMDGLFDFLEELRDLKIKCAVATSAPTENADFILSALSLQKYFAAILDSTHVQKGKPEPEVYLKASKSINFDPDRCIVFEDSKSGTEAGKRAGAKVVGVTSTHSAEEMENCDETVNNFTEVNAERLEKLVNRK